MEPSQLVTFVSPNTRTSVAVSVASKVRGSKASSCKDHHAMAQSHFTTAGWSNPTKRKPFRHTRQHVWRADWWFIRQVVFAVRSSNTSRKKENLIAQSGTGFTPEMEVVLCVWVHVVPHHHTFFSDLAPKATSRYLKFRQNSRVVQCEGCVTVLLGFTHSAKSVCNENTKVEFLFNVEFTHSCCKWWGIQ